MVENSAPFNGTSPGDAGAYSASDWTAIWLDIITRRLNSDLGGVLRDTGDGTNPPLQVSESSPQAKSVTVRIGSAMNYGWWYRDDAENVHSINANSSGSTRIDRIVLRLDTTLQTIRQTKIEGTPGAGAPSITQDLAGLGIWDIPLGQIELANGYTVVTDAMITDQRTSALISSPLEGGTGVEGVLPGQFYIGSDTENEGAVTPEVTGNYRMLVSDSAQDGNWNVVNILPTEILVSSVSAIEAITSPVQIDDAKDPAGNLTGAVASSQFPLSAGTYLIIGGGSEQAQNSGAPASEAFAFYLYDADSAADIDDVGGDRVQTIYSWGQDPSRLMLIWRNQVFTLGDDANVEVRVDGNLSAFNFGSVARDLPFSLAFIRLLD